MEQRVYGEFEYLRAVAEEDARILAEEFEELEGFEEELEEEERERYEKSNKKRHSLLAR